jgi:2-polyprenyl-6-hydroxyphenyl methylase / 3-demethylubiquinone-9 3-methyltransferase
VDPGRASSTVDDAEVARFSTLADRWWDEHGDMRMLHRLNPVRIGYIRDHAAARFGRDRKRLDSLAGLRILDVGCGGGILSEALAARGAEVVGIDLGEKALGVAKLHQLETGSSVDYRLVAAEALAAEDPAAFDVVACMELLEHVPDPAAIVAACGALCKPGGIVAISTINRTPKAYALAVVGAEYVLQLLPRGTHDYAKFLQPAEISRFARQAGVVHADIIGLAYNPFAKTFRLVPDTAVNYMMAFRRPANA